ncbi:hypothetical protein HDU67_000685 [Dinochytrium kinnereticum]|nr:hypothetical protein HDU67_000685 [Dinochytrium kinnereticum]
MVVSALLGDPVLAAVEGARERLLGGVGDALGGGEGGEAFGGGGGGGEGIGGVGTFASLTVPGSSRPGPGSLRTASIVRQRSDAAAADPVKVDDLKEVLAGNPSPSCLASGRPHSTDPSNPLPDVDSVGVASVASAEKSRSNVKVLLRNISVNMDSSRRSASPSLHPPPTSDTLTHRISSDFPRVHSGDTPPASPTPANPPSSSSSSSSSSYHHLPHHRITPPPHHSLSIVTAPPLGVTPMISPSLPALVVRDTGGVRGAVGGRGGGSAGGALRTASSHSSLRSLRLAEPTF